MENRGYIYVLANSSMPDLVKVGKTARLPSQRAQELSGVTGVPTPFIVVYEQLFEDCSVAEDYLHTILKQKGYRETDNREFFRAPISKIIHIISNMPGRINNSDDLNTESFNDGLISTHELSESQPWSDMLETALKYYNGDGDYIQDYTEAMKLYIEAAKLGCIGAYVSIGLMFKYGRGVPVSSQRALDYFKEGARKGDYYCYLEMGKLYLDQNQHDNYSKCMRLFFKNRNAQINTMVDKYEFIFPISCRDYIMYCLWKGTIPLQETFKEMAVVKNEIKEWMYDAIYTYKHKGNKEMMEDYMRGWKWVDKNL